MKLSINRNQVLFVIGFLATQGPNLEAVAKWLASLGGSGMVLDKV